MGFRPKLNLPVQPFSLFQVCNLLQRQKNRPGMKLTAMDMRSKTIPIGILLRTGQKYAKSRTNQGIHH